MSGALVVVEGGVAKEVYGPDGVLVEFIWDWDEVEGAQDCGDIETIEYYLVVFERLQEWMQNALNSNGNVDEMIRWLVGKKEGDDGMVRR